VTLAAVTYTKPPAMSGYALKIPDGNDETRFSDKSRIERPSKNRAPGNIIVAFTSVVMLLRLMDIAKISTGNALMSGRAVSSLSSSAMPVGVLLKSEWGHEENQTFVDSSMVTVQKANLRMHSKGVNHTRQTVTNERSRLSDR
jgi:hypothetical protein